MRKLLPWLLLVATMVTWGSAYVGIRIALHSFPPSLLGFLRYTIALLVLIFFYWFLVPEKKLFSHPKLLAITFITGALGIGAYNVFLNIGEIKQPAAIAGFIISTMPVFVTLISVVFLKNRFTLFSWLGTAISIAGILLIFYGQEHGPLHWDWSLASLLLSALCGALYTLLQKPLLKHCHPIEVVTGCVLGGVIVTSYSVAGISMHSISQINWSGALALLYLGIVPAAFSYLGYTYVIKIFPITQVAAALYIIPVSSLLLGAWVLHETPSTLELGGGGLALLGAIVVQRSQQLLQAKQLKAIKES